MLNFAIMLQNFAKFTVSMYQKLLPKIMLPKKCYQKNVTKKLLPKKCYQKMLPKNITKKCYQKLLPTIVTKMSASKVTGNILIWLQWGKLKKPCFEVRDRQRPWHLFEVTDRHRHLGVCQIHKIYVNLLKFL